MSKRALTLSCFVSHYHYMNTTVPRIKSILISCLLLAICLFLAGRLEAGAAAVQLPGVG